MIDKLGWRIIVVHREGIYQDPRETLDRISDALRERGARRVRRTYKAEYARYFPGRAARSRPDTLARCVRLPRSDNVASEARFRRIGRHGLKSAGQAAQQQGHRVGGRAGRRPGRGRTVRGPGQGVGVRAGQVDDRVAPAAGRGQPHGQPGGQGDRAAAVEADQVAAAGPSAKTGVYAVKRSGRSRRARNAWRVTQSLAAPEPSTGGEPASPASSFRRAAKSTGRRLSGSTSESSHSSVPW